MTTTTESRPASQAPPKRRLRNKLLDRRFQLKYTGYVVVVTLAVASVLGFFAYRFSEEQTEQLTITAAMYPDLHPEVAEDLEGWSREQDRRVLMAIVGGVALLTVILAITGILVTHKIVGPAYKMKLLLNQVAAGKIRLAGRLRQGDELQDVFEAFANMVEALREEQAREIRELDAAIGKMREAGTSDEVLAHVVEVRDRMQSALD